MRLSITVLSLFVFAELVAQIKISGNVVDESNEPLLGVNLYIEGTYDGATTDIDGRFSFTTESSGSLKLVASFIGFHTEIFEIKDATTLFNIQLKEEINKLNAVTITAGSFNASEGSKRTVLKPLDVVTTAGATADIPGALNTLPGTQAVGETGRLFVRGGDGRETKTFIDGMLVHNEYSPSAPNTPGRSRFSPFMFKGTSFSTGGYSAEYGQALSSALILDSKDAAEADRTDISLMTVGADISTTRSLPSGSIAAKVQYTNLTPYFATVDQDLQWDKAPTDLNMNMAYRLKTSQTGLLKLYTNYSSSSLAIYESSIEDPEVSTPVNIKNRFSYFNLSYRELVAEKWGIRAGASATTSKDHFAVGEIGDTESSLLGFHGKAVADYQHSDRLAIIFGGEVFQRKLEQEAALPEATNNSVHERIASSFAEAELFLSKDLAIKAGVRGEYTSNVSGLKFDPRVSAAYKTGENSQVSVAYGSFRQQVDDRILILDENAQQEQASHLIANYQWAKKGRTFRIEAYDKKYQNLTRFASPNDASTFQFDGTGRASGLDLFWRDNESIDGLDYWVSYSFLDTKRLFRDFPEQATPSFASAHNFSIVTKKFFDDLKSQVGVTYSFASPRPY
ncbi:MAG: TonB-dependent receptor, partial [Bacteroidota bacterium]